MATYYVRSTDGNNADDGSTWALAKADLHTTAWAAGDVIYVSQNHAQQTAASFTIATGGTIASPTKIICVNDGSEPPSDVAKTATVSTVDSGVYSISVSGYVYCEGITFNLATTASTVSFNLIEASGGAVHQVYKNCTFIQERATASSGQLIHISGSANGAHAIKFLDCVLGGKASNWKLLIGSVVFEWVGGSIASSYSFSPSALIGFGNLGRAGSALIDGVDFSNFGNASAFNFVLNTSDTGSLVVRNCKLPTNWAGGLFSGSLSRPGLRAELYNCDSGDTNYRIWVEDYTGKLIQDTGIYRSGGYSDGTTPLSWKIATTSNAKYPLILFVTPEMMVWNETTGSSMTATIELIVNSSGTALKNDEIWLEVQYLGTSGVPLSSFVRNAKTDILTTAADQTTSSATWTGATTPTKQKLSVSFTPQKKGFVIGKVFVAKASTTIYVCPKMDLS